MLSSGESGTLFFIQPYTLQLTAIESASHGTRPNEIVRMASAATASATAICCATRRCSLKTTTPIRIVPSGAMK
jgi:hypothetical protein